MKGRKNKFDPLKEAKRVARQSVGQPKPTQIHSAKNKQKVQKNLKNVNWLGEDDFDEMYDVYE